MRKFVFHSKKGTTSIMEVEVEIVRPVEDPSVMWMQPGEYRARIMQPTSFHQRVERKLADGSKQVTMEPDVWCSHAFYDTLEAAKVKLESLTRGGFEFEIRKGRKTEYTEEEVQAAIAAVEIVML